MKSKQFFNKLMYFMSRYLVKRIEKFPEKRRKMFDGFFSTLMPVRKVLELKKMNYIKRASSGPETTFYIERENGFAKVIVGANAVTEIGIKVAENVASKLSAGSIKRTNSKEYLQQIYSLSNMDKQGLPLLAFATSPSVLKSAQDYLGKFPLLHDISVFYSPSSSESFHGDWQGSQLYHRDGGGTGCVKIWLLAKDVSESDGPTTLLTAKVSAEISKKMSYKPGNRVKDELIDSLTNQSPIKLTGKKGEMFATDTDRCFHYGSRTTSNSSRLVIMFHFVDNNSSYYFPFLRLNYLRKMPQLSPDVKKYCESNKLAAMALRYRLNNVA